MLAEKIVSGGQTGVDRAALDVALKLGIPCGGWCPKGRRAEDGPLALRYPLAETPSEDYWERTEWNVRDSDGTLAILRETLTEGTAYTIEKAKEWGKPYLVVDLSQNPTLSSLSAWVESCKIKTMNVAGPRESKCPGIYKQTSEFLEKWILSLQTKS